ncbi:MAG: hypothetical protein ABI566_03475 [Pseudolysinimonas sp.]
MHRRTNLPELMPNLSTGAHRTPRQGACFMEFASYLAGEPWSDRPECTDPVLAALARGANDGLSDARRDELVLLIPRVIGLRGDDELVGLTVALRAGTEALPVASIDRQRTLALGIQNVRNVLASLGATAGGLDAAARQALSDVPDAVAWAVAYRASRPTAPSLHRSATLAIARIAAVSIAEACIDDADSRLIRVLERAIADVEALVAVPAASTRILVDA